MARVRYALILVLSLMGDPALAEHGDNTPGKRENPEAIENCGRIADSVCSFLEGCLAGSSRCKTKSASYCTFVLEKKLKSLKRGAVCFQPIQVNKLESADLEFSCKVVRTPDPKAHFVVKADGSKSQVDRIREDLKKTLKEGEILQSFNDRKGQAPDEHSIFTPKELGAMDRMLLRVLTGPLGNYNEWLRDIPDGRFLQKIKNWAAKQAGLKPGTEIMLLPRDVDEKAGTYSGLDVYANVNGKNTAVALMGNFNNPDGSGPVFALKQRQYDALGNRVPLDF